MVNVMKKQVQKLLKQAGITVNGKDPWDIKVRYRDFYQRVLAGGSLALGESYMDGWWDCKALDKFFEKIFLARLNKKGVKIRHVLPAFLKAKLTNMQSKKRSLVVGEQHYDIGNDLYSLMLDKRMNYSCGYWKNAKTLNQAQVGKLDLICKKIGLKPGMKVLDIGCGWGGFAQYAAKKYKVKVVGVTISKEQAALARKRCKGLPVQIRFLDYRKLDEQFDRIISIGMFEHVGYKNYRKYMEVASKCLKPDGLFLLHTIGSNRSVKTTDPWINKYIFPNSMLPSANQITKASEGLFVMEDWHNFSADYDKTLLEWHKNFNKNWSKIRQDYDARFFRMWNYYLLACAGTFRARHNQLWQIVFSKEGVKGGYKSLR